MFQPASFAFAIALMAAVVPATAMGTCPDRFPRESRPLPVPQAAPARACAAVPATPPDSMPREYETLADTVSGGSHYAGVVLRDIVVLQFRRGTPHADKKAVICLIRAIVVGGRPLAENEGIYLLRIPGDRTAETLFRAIGKLRLQPQVSFVGPEEVLSNLTPKPDHRPRGPTTD